MSDLHGAAASYAVDALDPVERADFETHLASCSSCRSEVTEFADTLAELAPLASVAPPMALRNSVLAAVAGLQQTGPQRASRSADQANRAGDEDVEVAPRRALASVTELRPLEPHEVVPLEEHPSVVPDMPWLGVAAALSEDMGRQSRWRDRVLGGLLAAALVLVLVLGGWVYVTQQEIQAQTTKAQQETALLAARDAKIYPADPGELSVSWVVSDERGQALFVANNLRDPEANSVYQLWVVRDDSYTPAGLLEKGGDVQLLLTESVKKGDELTISRELTPTAKRPTERLADITLS